MSKCHILGPWADIGKNGLGGSGGLKNPQKIGHH